MPNLNKATTVQVLFQPKIDLSYPEVTGNSKSRTTLCCENSQVAGMAILMDSKISIEGSGFMQRVLLP